MTDLLYFILFHWYFLALKKSALRKCPYINNEFGQPIFWHVSQIWIDVLHQLSLLHQRHWYMSPEVSSGNESDLKTGPVRALIGAEEHIASHHNVVSPGVLYKISLLVTWERNWVLLNRQLCRIHIDYTAGTPYERTCRSDGLIIWKNLWGCIGYSLIW